MGKQTSETTLDQMSDDKLHCKQVQSISNISLPMNEMTVFGEDDDMKMQYTETNQAYHGVMTTDDLPDELPDSPPGNEKQVMTPYASGNDENVMMMIGNNVTTKGNEELEKEKLYG